MKLTVRDLDQHYGGSQVLRSVSLEVEPGQCLAVLGRNGAGKSTLLKCLVGLLPVTRGSILFDDAEVTQSPNYRRSRAGVAYVPQGREIFAELTVRENLVVGGRAPFDAAGGGVAGALRRMRLFTTARPTDKWQRGISRSAW